MRMKDFGTRMILPTMTTFLFDNAKHIDRHE